jgi:phosphatidylserine/phosphatidylglycerophosphate/cardiolipin synthase-like enzyme
MKTLKVIFILMVFFLMLQACGARNDLPTSTPLQTDPPVSEPIAPDTVATEIPRPMFSNIPLKVGIGHRASWLELYFTDPSSPFAAERSGGVDGLVAASISAARESVDVSINSLGVSSITSALIRAHNRGKTVRIVMETNNVGDRLNPQQLKDAGIPLVEDQRDGVMNNRFVVIDRNQVWTGSVNYTSSSLFSENNAMIRIFSKEIADNYTREFEEMFLNDQFGADIVPETPNPNVIIEGTQVEVLFSPDDVVVARLLQLLGEAQESIYFLAYSFNSNYLGDAIRAKAAQGITVAGVMEPSQINPELAGEFELFRRAGLDVRLGSGSELIGHKVMVIDGKIVVMGSYDFTSRAENVNDENVLIIHNEEVAQKFMEEFQRIQSRAQP